MAGQVCLVTGAASGIGAACVTMLADRGAERIIAFDRDEAALASLQADCELLRYSGDVADEGLWQSLEADVRRVDRAVLNAGIANGADIVDMEFDDWRRVLSANLDGMFLSLRSVMRLASDGASVVLTASVSGLKAEPSTAAYGASKAAVIQLAKVAAKEGAARRIRVNAIAPGGVDTPIWDQTPFFRELVDKHGGNRQAALDEMAGIATPLGRFAGPEEVAAQIGFLLSDDAATITGTVLVSDGGYSL